MASNTFIDLNGIETNHSICIYVDRYIICIKCIDESSLNACDNLYNLKLYFCEIGVNFSFNWISFDVTLETIINLQDI